MAKKFWQTQGVIGSIASRPGYFAPTANPHVLRGPIVAIGRGGGGAVASPRAATATVAGRQGIGCCSDCSKDYRGT